MNDEDRKILEEKIEELEEEIHELEHDLIHDHLTGLRTRAFFEEEIKVYLEAIGQNDKGKRKEWFGFKNISVAFFDIDHFKQINDNYGHDKGDEVLKTVAEAIRASLRSGDTAARWGGEEMIVSLLGANEEDAKKKAEEIRLKVQGLGFVDGNNTNPFSVGISAGVASAGKGESLEDLVKRADEALYNAKETGRNKVIAYSELNK
jgi:diguanylate cyclase (GGDEF)-like protein